MTRNRKAGETIVHVDQRLAGETVAAAVRSLKTDLSWSAVRNLIAHRHVQIDGNLCLDHGRRLKSGEVLKLFDLPFARLPDARDIDLVFSDESIAVVNKPPGLNSVRHAEERNWSAKRRQFQPTLDELLPEVLAGGSIRGRSGGRQAGRSRDALEPSGRSRRFPAVFPVHRLDRETSGLMVFARTSRAAENLIEQFSSHDIERVYLAIVRGEVAAQTVDNILVRDRGDGLRGGLPAGDDRASQGQQAITHLRPLKKAGPWQLVECRLETGRTHQIRIHLAELGSPVCGDRKYSGPRGKPLGPDSSGARRVALHATRLGLTHPRTGRPLVFESPLPPDLSDLWRQLENGSRSGRGRPPGPRGAESG